MPDGWALTLLVCVDPSGGSSSSEATATATIDLAAGETVTCTFTNTKNGTLIIDKVTNPAGEQQLFGFTGTDLPGTADDTFSLADGTAAKSVSVPPSTYHVSEDADPDGWNLTGIACVETTPNSSDAARTATAVVDPGETVTCTFTNTKNGTLIIDKVTDPSGEQQLFGFTGTDLPGSANDTFSLADATPAKSVSVPPDTYHVSEDADPAGWELDGIECVETTANSSDAGRTATAVVDPGETVTCTFQNQKDANIIVIKQTNPDGDQQPFAFTASYGNFSLSDGQQNDSGDLDPDTYSVAETVPQGWDLESATCSDESSPALIDLDAGETVICTFLNVKDSKIIIEKQTLPGGDTQSFHFDASYDEGGFNLLDNQQNDSGDLDPGQYTVSEDVPDGWDAHRRRLRRGRGRLRGRQRLHRPRRGRGRDLRLREHEARDDHRREADAFRTAHPRSSPTRVTRRARSATTARSSSTSSSRTRTPRPRRSQKAGSCRRSSATTPTRRARSARATATFRVEAGETVKCTFTNSQTPTLTGQGAIDVQKTATPTTVKEPGGPVTFSVTIRNTSTVSSPSTTSWTTSSATSTTRAGTAASTCRSSSCRTRPRTARSTGRSPGPGGTTHVNVVTVDGHDGFGHNLTDTDDARVDITPRLIDLVIVKDGDVADPAQRHRQLLDDRDEQGPGRRDERPARGSGADRDHLPDGEPVAGHVQRGTRRSSPAAWGRSTPARR